MTIGVKKLQQKQLTPHVEQINSTAEPLKQTHVDEYSRRVVLDVPGVLGTVVDVVPLVRRKQQLHQRVGHVGVL